MNVLTVLFTTGAVGALLFIVLFAVRSPGWWRSDVGRPFMAMMVVLLGLLTLVVIGRFAGPLPRWVWTGGMASLDLVIWWCVIILLRKQHIDRRDRQ